MTKDRATFKSWIRKLEGEEDDNLSSEKETRSGFGEGIDLLHQWLKRNISLSELQSGFESLNYQEREAIYRERKRLDLNYSHVDPMGLYDGDRSAYQQSVEYLTRNQTSEQQDEVSATPSRYTPTFSTSFNDEFTTAYPW